jgi:hypothetical protein
MRVLREEEANMNSIRFASAALAAGVGFASQASVLFSGTGFNPEAATNASGSALFQISGNLLTVTLNNTTSPRTTAQGNALTGVAFDFKNASPVPVLTLVSTALGKHQHVVDERPRLHAAGELRRGFDRFRWRVQRRIDRPW